jgi:hypothetical protein
MPADPRRWTVYLPPRRGVEAMKWQFDFSPYLPVLATGFFGLAGLAAMFGALLFAQPIFFALGIPSPAVAQLSSCGEVFASCIWGVIGFALLVYAGFAVAAGVALRRRRRPTLCRVVAAVTCLFFPFGTAIGGTTLYALRRHPPPAPIPTAPSTGPPQTGQAG